jgi:uncharacterized membrane protein
MYNTLQFLHVVAAIVWLGSGVGFFVLLTLISSSGDRGALLSVGQHMDTLGNRLFGPAAMATLLFGILTVLAGQGISFADLWITIGFAGVAVSLALVAVRAPTAKRIGPAVQEHGPASAEVDALLAKARTINIIDIVLLLIVVWAMVVKPGA